jgi:transposase-like protein
MPVAFKRYRCKDCGREFESYNKAKKCENSHPIPVSVKAICYTIAKAFPYQVEVTFNNGEKHIYNSVEMGG